MCRPLSYRSAPLFLQTIEMKKYEDLIFIQSVIGGVFVIVCDYWVQMTTVETTYFVSKLLSLDSMVLNLSSYGCVFLFPFWITGVYFVYKTMCRVNRRVALLCSASIVYSLLMLAFFHYSYAIIYRIGMSGTMDVAGMDWQVLVASNLPFYPFMFILLPVSWLVVGFSNFSAKAVVPRWSIVMNPVMLTLISSVMVWIDPRAECLQPGIFSLGVTSYYAICWMSLKKERNLCVERKF
ncbi:hypothetical protein JCM10003_2782 [Bacteroides pyogenes JCM 10003]|nr:hypothetical protein JCM10003_2782 [Bacteroides pyogenes JCM 10003]SUV33589.1 Uncharacterised protein [Bacteroides pyogenes]